LKDLKGMDLSADQPTGRLKAGDRRGRGHRRGLAAAEGVWDSKSARSLIVPLVFKKLFTMTTAWVDLVSVSKLI
jgi:hypothetical protein